MIQHRYREIINDAVVRSSRFNGSTPESIDTSTIARSFLSGNKRIQRALCPCCGTSGKRFSSFSLLHYSSYSQSFPQILAFFFSPSLEEKKKKEKKAARHVADKPKKRKKKKKKDVRKVTVLLLIVAKH